MIRFISAGESHGPKISAIVDGLPAGFPVDRDAIQSDLKRRQKGFGRSARMKIETDLLTVTAGIIQGKTTGAPIAFEIANLDHEKWRDRDIPAMTIPRPGHADLAGAIKYGHGDLRLSLERASARETAMRVAAGGFCKAIMKPFGIYFASKVVQIGKEARKDCSSRQPYIHSVMKQGDTLGGIFEVRASGIIPGLGSYSQWDRRLDGRIAQAMLSIPAMKGIEIGPAFENATKFGSEVHDPIHLESDGKLSRSSNNSGGLEGGVTNGEDIVVRVAMKPISTLLKKQIPSVDLQTGLASKYPYERSDFCAVERALVIGEAMLALVICDAFLEKIGGDSFDEIQKRYMLLKRANIRDINLEGKPWQWK